MKEKTTQRKTNIACSKVIDIVYSLYTYGHDFLDIQHDIINERYLARIC